MVAPFRLVLRRYIGIFLRAVTSQRFLLRVGRILEDEAVLTFPNHRSINGEQKAIAAMIAASDLSKPLVVLDVGANEGQWARILFAEAERLPETRLEVHAFEPMKEARDRLSTMASEISDRHMFSISDFGVSSAAGKRAPFFVRGDGLGVSSLYESDGFDRMDLVPVTSIDEYAVQHGLALIDFVKVDTEGHDFEVVLGAMSLLRSGAIRFLQFEYNWRWIDARKYLRDVFDLLHDGLPYEIAKVAPGGLLRLNGWWPGLESYREANYLLIRNDLTNAVPFAGTLDQLEG